MADVSTPTHGKYGAIWRLRPGNFNGSQLNDAVLGTAYNGAASAAYEVAIDGLGTPDTFKWSKNGGSCITGVAITGAAQTIDDAQTVAFGNTTGHTLGDMWTIGNLYAEPCTEVGKTAQITDSTKCILNPHAPPVFTDSGGAHVLWVDYSSGMAYFDKAVTSVTVRGNNGYVPQAALQRVGYVTDWSLSLKRTTAKITAMGDDWESYAIAQGDGSGTSEGYYIGNFSAYEEMATGAPGATLLQLFTYDPAKNATGGHFNAWVLFTDMGLKAPMTDMSKESTSFTITGKPGWVVSQ